MCNQSIVQTRKAAYSNLVSRFFGRKFTKYGFNILILGFYTLNLTLLGGVSWGLMGGIIEDVEADYNIGLDSETSRYLYMIALAIIGLLLCNLFDWYTVKNLSLVQFIFVFFTVCVS